MISRANRSPLSDWWWTVDRGMISLVLILLLAGFIFSFAASPPVAERLDLDSLHFVLRQAVFAPVAAAVMIGVSFLTPRQVRRTALILLLVCLALMVLVLFIGEEIKGARRWLHVAGMSIQPSELIKPAFIVITAWLFAEGNQRPDVPGTLLAVLLLVIVAALLVAEPDLGQTALFVAVWGALFFLAGVNTVFVAGLGGLGVAGLVSAYYAFPHVAGRINRFLDPDSGDNFQIMTAMQSFERGGWSGTGPGEGIVKRVLPDSHTDFVFAVVGEEFGIVLCLLIVASRSS
jgi:cell division protein FtsW